MEKDSVNINRQSSLILAFEFYNFYIPTLYYFTMDYKEETLACYEQYTDAFTVKFERHLARDVSNELDLFLNALNDIEGTRILDLGSGPGQHSIYFRSRGFDPFCVDISPAMIARCKAQGLDGFVMDMEHLTLPEEAYAGIWAYASLLHLPKQRLPPVIRSLVPLLLPEGIVGIAVKEGTFEGFEESHKYPGTKRWFSYFHDEEIRALFAPYFTCISATRTNIVKKDPAKNAVFMHYLFARKD